MPTIEAKKQIEIALLAGQVAYAALSLQGLQDYDLSRLTFLELVKALEDLEKAFPWRSRKA